LENRREPTNGHSILDETISFAVVARGSIEDFIDVINYIEKLCQVVYKTKSIGKLRIIREHEGVKSFE